MATTIVTPGSAAAYSTAWQGATVKITGAHDVTPDPAFAQALEVSSPAVTVSYNTLYQATADAVEQVLLARSRTEVQLRLAVSDDEWEALKLAHVKLTEAARDLWTAATKTDQANIVTKIQEAEDAAGSYASADLYLTLERAKTKILDWTPPVI